jgi:UDP-N-acetylmuramoyl-tripeptide--D-alanyl-D-alanine ligase
LILTLDRVAEACGGALDGNPAQRCTGVSTDTRTLREGMLFVALRGEKFDAHDFLADAVAAGATALLVAKPPPAGIGAASIVVRDTLAALGDLARAARAGFTGPVVAITGSNGKTTTKELCADILTAIGVPVRRTRGNLNNHIGLPLSILALEEGDRALVVELGMNHPGEIAALARIARPTVGAITQVAPAHLGMFGSLDAIARAKGELYEGIEPTGCAVVNADDARVLAQADRFAGRRLLYGFAAQADFRAVASDAEASAGRFELRSPLGTCQVQMTLPGRHLVEDALCAATAAYASGLLEARHLTTVANAISGFAGVAGRLTRRVAPGGRTLLDDSYNANPHSARAAFETLRRVAGSGRAVAVLGDMLELGDTAEQLHAEVGRRAAELRLDALIGLGPLAACAVEGARAAGIAHAVVASDHHDAARRARALTGSGDAVLVKGSRGSRMERVAQALLQEQD